MTEQERDRDEDQPRPTTKAEEYQQRILRVQLHVQKHLDQPSSLEELAEAAKFSPFHFHRIFRGIVGESLAQYTKRLRLERAAMQLKIGEQSITQIGLNAGYEAHEAFSRAFKDRFGFSPREYRKRWRTEVTGESNAAGDESSDTPPAPDSELNEMKVAIESIGPIRIGFIRHVGPYD